MRIRRASGLALACLAVGGCGGGASSKDGEPQAELTPAPAPATTPTRPNAPTPPPPTTPPVPRATYLDALDAYCATTVRAVERLGRTETDRGDPVAPIATFARRYRVGLERLGRLTPPTALRRLHLLTLAQARESADRIDDGVRFGRAGDIDAATSALGLLSGLLPDAGDLPRAVRRGAPACEGPGA